MDGEWRFDARVANVSVVESNNYIFIRLDIFIRHARVWRIEANLALATSEDPF